MIFQTHRFDRNFVWITGRSIFFCQTQEKRNLCQLCNYLLPSKQSFWCLKWEIVEEWVHSQLAQRPKRHQMEKLYEKGSIILKIVSYCESCNSLYTHQTKSSCRHCWIFSSLVFIKTAVCIYSHLQLYFKTNFFNCTHFLFVCFFLCRFICV